MLNNVLDFIIDNLVWIFVGAALLVVTLVAVFIGNGMPHAAYWTWVGGGTAVLIGFLIWRFLMTPPEEREGSWIGRIGRWLAVVTLAILLPGWIGYTIYETVLVVRPDTRPYRQVVIDAAQGASPERVDLYQDAYPSKQVRQFVRAATQRPVVSHKAQEVARLSYWPWVLPTASAIVAFLLLLISATMRVVKELRKRLDAPLDGEFGAKDKEEPAAVQAAAPEPVQGGGFWGWVGRMGGGFLHDLALRLPRELLAEFMGHRLFGR